jgi:hypothetical protein
VVYTNEEKMDMRYRNTQMILILEKTKVLKFLELGRCYINDKIPQFIYPFVYLFYSLCCVVLCAASRDHLARREGRQLDESSP